MNSKDTIGMAKEAGGDDWDIFKDFMPEIERFAELFAAAKERDDINKLAAWMMQRGYATGHGESIEDLLQELDWQIAEGWTRAMVNGVNSEREACAKVLDAMAKKDKLSNYYKVAANAIRARGQG